MNKVYVISGSTSGIGKALLEKLADSNIIFAGYRNQDCLEIFKDKKNVYPFYLDYSKPETIQSAADYILENTNKIDTLVNVAGCVVAGPVENLDLKEVRRQFDVNVFGHIELAQKLINKLKGGRIINVSSMASFGIFPFIAPYSASKRCLDMFFNSLLIENKKNIKVISIKPGVIATPLWDKSIKENSKYFKRYGEYAAEMEYVIANAEKNGKQGLPISKVVDVILKADTVKNPKLSYVVGYDALIASIISKLPQAWVNKMVKLGIKLKKRPCNPRPVRLNKKRELYVFSKNSQ